MKRQKKINPPLVPYIFIKLFSRRDDGFSISGDFDEEFLDLAETKGGFYAKLWYWKHFLKSLPGIMKDSVYWRSVMFKNYLKIAVRNFKNKKGFSFINIFGLAVGFTCSILIFLYVQYEMNWDSFHKDANRIYRVISTLKRASGTTRFAGAGSALTPYIRDNLPEAEYVSRFWSNRDSQVRYADRLFKEQGKDLVFADKDIFNIINIPFKMGNPNTALERPKTAVITEQTAKKYFGKENPMGKTVRIDTVDYEITGITENLPGNSCFGFKFLMSWETLANDRMLGGTEWGGFFLTLVKLAPGVTTDEFSNQITQAYLNNNQEYLDRMQSEYSASLQNIKNIHLKSDFVFDFTPKGNILYVYIFSGVAVIILLIASINFMNLSTARSANRANEVGMRKVAGAMRKQLFWQFIGESFFLTFFSLFIALIFVIIVLPEFNQLSLLKIQYSSLLNTNFLIGLLLIVTFVGIAAGSYPALFLSSFKPGFVLRGHLRSGLKSGILRKILVVAQYAISIIMIVVTIMFSRQLNFMKNKSLGFDKEKKMIINMQGNRVNPNNYLAVKREFLKDTSIQGASFSSSIPGRWLYSWRIWPTGQRTTNAHLINCMGVDEDFFSLYDLNLIAGRNFRENEPISGWILNETAVNTYGWNSPEEAITKTIMDREPPTHILGVMKDYHYKGLQNNIEPQAVFRIHEDFRYLTLRINTENLPETLLFLEQQYNSLFPGQYFEYFFLDDDFDRQYLKEEQTGIIFNIFTFLGIFIACLGLFGLAAFMAEQRTKEIGIRKAIGASVSGIIVMLSKEFIKWILISNIIAWPAAYFVINRMLQEFAYRTNIGVLPFLASAVLSLIIAVITVSYQSVKAAMSNPVDSLKYE